MSDWARRFAGARLSGGTVDGVGPLTLDQGYAIADAAAPLLGITKGWKVGATNADGQAFLQIDEPICGRIFGPIAFSGEKLALRGARPAEAEPEILLRLATGSEPSEEPPRIAAAHLGLEINRPSHDDAFGRGAGFIVADNAAHVALIVGPIIDLACLDHPGSIAVKLIRNGIEEASGDASAVLGTPLAAVRWLASRRSLRAGDWVATGAITKSCEFACGDHIEADFGALGSVEVERR